LFECKGNDLRGNTIYTKAIWKVILTSFHKIPYMLGRLFIQQYVDLLLISPIRYFDTTFGITNLEKANLLTSHLKNNFLSHIDANNSITRDIYFVQKL